MVWIVHAYNVIRCFVPKQRKTADCGWLLSDSLDGTGKSILVVTIDKHLVGLVYAVVFRDAVSFRFVLAKLFVLIFALHLLGETGTMLFQTRLCFVAIFVDTIADPRSRSA